jgi:hypothetical protein
MVDIGGIVHHRVFKLSFHNSLGDFKPDMQAGFMHITLGNTVTVCSVHITPNTNINL